MTWTYRQDNLNTITIEDEDGKEMCSLYTDGEVTREMRTRAALIVRAVNKELARKL